MEGVEEGEGKGGGHLSSVHGVIGVGVMGGVGALLVFGLIFF